MNRHFLEFWGKFLLDAAKSQKLLEDITALFQRGLREVPNYARLFKACYGLNEVAEDTPDFLSLWQKAEEDFRKSFQEYLNLLGVVSREEYDALARENEALKDKLAQQEETIQHLRLLVEEKGLGLEAATLEFQQLLKRQGEQFQKFLQGLGQAAQSEENNPDQT
uniref:Uncharacterized protein n=1 Tax=Desulfobacca acetoxidans TaxID=60893 RepID=A0A7V4G9U4_9BACT